MLNGSVAEKSCGIDTTMITGKVLFGACHEFHKDGVSHLRCEVRTSVQAEKANSTGARGIPSVKDREELARWMGIRI